MKKIIILVLLAVSFAACKNQAEQQDNTTTEITEAPIKTDVQTEKDSHAHAHPHGEIQSHSHEYLYKSNNGEIFDVTFFEANDKMQVKIKRDNEDELVLDQTISWSKGAEYEKGDYKWISKNNEGTFSDGKVSQTLAVISPLQYTFTNNKEDIVIVYFSKNDKRFVSIQKDDKTQVTLEQTSAWAKGAEYGKDAIKWRGDGNKGVLIEEGIETKYQQKSQ